MSQLDRYFEEGFAYFKQGNYRKAIASLTSVIKLEPDYAVAYCLRGEALKELEQYPKALKDLDKAIALNPHQADFYCLRGWTKEELEDYRGAILDFDRAIAFNYYDANVYISRGYNRRVLGDLPNAIADYTEAIAIDAENWHGYSHRGYALKAVGDISGAIEDFTKVIQLNHNDAKYYYERGCCYLELNNHRAALNDFNMAIEIDPRSSEYYFERGYANSRLDDLQSAIRDYTETIRLNPKYLEAYVNRGNVYARLNKHKLAIKDYTKAIEIDSTIVAIYQNRGKAYAESQESHKAIADWQQGIKLLQDRDDIYANTISTVLLNLIEAESAKNPSIITEDRAIATDSNSAIPCYLETEEEIRAFIHGIKDFKTLWLDTEIADWQTKHPRLSLIQVLANPQDITGESTYILDVLDKPEIVSEFIDRIMANASIEKVFHNASYDLRYLGGKERAKNITCTYKIAQKISKKVLRTSNLQLKTLAVELCNFPQAEIINEQGSDWGKRPLSEEQIKYAKMDTVYLARVHHRLLEFKPDIPSPRSSSFSVTDVRVALECPRLFYLNKHFGGKTLFRPTSSSLGIGNTFHKLADEFIATVKKQPQFQALFEPPADRLEPKAIASQMQDIFYSLVFFPNYLQPTIQTKPDLAPALDRVWQGLRNLIQKWTELLIKNRAYCDADDIFKRTFVSTETKLQHDFNLPDGTLQPIAGKLDCLIYDYSKQHFCVVELKTYTPVDPSAQLAQVALYSYMIQQTKKVPVDSAVYCVLPEFKEYFYPCSELETNLHQVIPFKLQQMQQWLQWQPSQADAPPPTSNSALCNICPQQEKCQHYFPCNVSNDEPPKNSPPSLPESESAIAKQKLPKNSPTPLPESEPEIADESIGRELVETLQSFNVDVEYLGAIAGATFIRIKLKPGKGVKVASILKLAADLQVQLSIPRPPLIATQPGYVSVDLPRENRQTAHFKDYIQRQKKPDNAAVKIAMGIDLEGKLIEAKLADPNTCHFLVGGTTGSGKSEFLRSLLLSLIDRHSPKQVKIALVDPKRVTFTEFEQMPWLLSPIVKDSEAAIALMEKLVTEMDERYNLFETAGCSDLDTYNQKQTSTNNYLPRIVCIFDEYADFMTEKETRHALESSIKRLGGMARAAGIHLIVATQRPEAKVVTPIIRSNLPGRVALTTASEADSKIILGGSSTEAALLLGKGDLFFQVNGRLQRLQSLYASVEV